MYGFKHILIKRKDRVRGLKILKLRKLIRSIENTETEKIY